MKRNILVSLFCFIVLFSFNNCELFKDIEALTIDNQSDFTIDVFVNDEYENTVSPGNTYTFSLYTKQEYILECRADPHQWGPIEVTLEKGKPYTWTIENPLTGKIEVVNNSSYNVNFLIKQGDQGYVGYYNIVYANNSGIFEILSGITYDIRCEAIEDGFIWEQTGIYIENEEIYTWIIENPVKREITIDNKSLFDVYIFINGDYENSINSQNSFTYEKYINKNYKLTAIIIGGEYDGKSWQENIYLTEEGFLWELEPCTELLPSENCSLWNFENNFNDEFNLIEWNTTSNVTYSIINKFGNCSFFSSNSLSQLSAETIYNSGTSQSAGLWFYIEASSTQFTCDLIDLCTPNKIDNININLRYYGNGNARIMVILLIKNYYKDYFSDYLNINEWHYIAFAYNLQTNIFYLIIDDNITTISPSSSTWINEPFEFGTSAYNYNNNYLYLDELVWFQNQFIDPQIFVDHYNRNAPWGAKYIP